MGINVTGATEHERETLRGIAALPGWEDQVRCMTVFVKTNRNATTSPEYVRWVMRNFAKPGFESLIDEVHAALRQNKTSA